MRNCPKTPTRARHFCRLRGALQHSEDQVIRLQQGGDPQRGLIQGTIPVIVIGSSF